MGATSCCQPPAPPRLVYLDLGAAHGDTLEGFRRLPSPHRTAGNWEIYAFEASALLQPHVERLTRWMSGHAEARRPLHCVPPVGSTQDMLFFARSMGCDRADANHAKFCVSHKVDMVAATALSADIDLMDPEVVLSRLRRARDEPLPRDAALPRFTLVPAAAGGGAAGGGDVAPGGLHSRLDLGSLLGRPMGASFYRPFMCSHRCFEPAYERAVAREDEGRLAATLNATQLRETAARWLRDDGESGLPRARERERWLPVQVVDIPSWLTKSFRAEDYVIVKADIEGAEHELIRGLAARRAFGLIDLWAWECHHRPSDPRRNCHTSAQILASHNVSVVDICHVHACGRPLLSAFWRSRVAEWRDDVRADPLCDRILNVTGEAEHEGSVEARAEAEGMATPPPTPTPVQTGAAQSRST